MAVLDRINKKNAVIFKSRRELLDCLSAFEGGYEIIAMLDNSIVVRLACPEQGIEFLIFCDK